MGEAGMAGSSEGGRVRVWAVGDGMWCGQGKVERVRMTEGEWAKHRKY